MNKILLLSLFLVSGAAYALDLPEMSYSDQIGFLKSFPLGKASSMDVFEAYGPPKSKLDGLPGNSEAWTYYKYGPDDVSYTFTIKDGKVYDITNRYKGFLGPTKRKARELQGLEK